AGLRDGLQAEEEGFASAPRRKGHEFVVEPEVGGALAGPPAFQGCDRSEKFFRPRTIRADVVVPENQRAAGHAADFIDDLADGPITHSALIHLRDGAIVAGKRAAARSDGHAFAIGASLYQIPTWRGHFAQVRQKAGFVNAL